jgi:hypothetical protein
MSFYSSEIAGLFYSDDREFIVDEPVSPSSSPPTSPPPTNHFQPYHPPMRKITLHPHSRRRKIVIRAQELFSVQEEEEEVDITDMQDELDFLDLESDPAESAEEEGVQEVPVERQRQRQEVDLELGLGEVVQEKLHRPWVVGWVKKIFDTLSQWFFE